MTATLKQPRLVPVTREQAKAAWEAGHGFSYGPTVAAGCTWPGWAQLKGRDGSFEAELDAYGRWPKRLYLGVSVARKMGFPAPPEPKRHEAPKDDLIVGVRHACGCAWGAHHFATCAKGVR